MSGSVRPKPSAAPQATSDPQLQDVRWEDDFSPKTAVTRELALQTDARETVRELDRKAMREVNRAQSEATMSTPSPTADWSQFAATWTNKAQQVLDQEKARQRGRDISSYPAVADIIKAYDDAGITVTTDDVRNMVHFGVLDSAANRVIAALNVGDDRAVKNVALSLQQTSPAMAALLPDYVTDKIKDSVTDPTVVSQIADKAVSALSWLATPFIAINDATMHRLRAGLYVQKNTAGGDSPLAPAYIVGGAFSGDAMAATEAGQYNEQYIQSLRDSGKYTDTQINVALEVSRRAALGDPQPALSALQEMYQDDPEAQKAIRDIMWVGPNSPMAELLRQVDSAHRGNTGQMLGSAGFNQPWYNEYDPSRGTKLHQDIANVTGMATSFVLDPTLLLSKAGRTMQAMKWALAPLAPGGKPAAEVFRAARFGRLPITSPAYRYMDQLAKSLNTLDDLEGQARAATGADKTRLQAQAAAHRQRMTRQFNELPDDLIEEFRTSPWRNTDGKIDVEHMAAHIDDTNTAHLTVAGEVSDVMLDTGATEMMRRAALERLQNEKTFYGQVSARNMGRDVLVPRMSLARMLRMKAVNNIGVKLTAQPKVDAMLDDFLAADTPEGFAQALSDNALEFGRAVRGYKFDARGGAYDSARRMFASLPSKNFIRLTDASDAPTVYKLARVFMPKRAAEMVSDAFRQGDIGDRRLIISGLVRSAAASRGLTMSAAETDVFVRQLTAKARGAVTGSMDGERYGVQVGMKPTERAALAAQRDAAMAQARAGVKAQKGSQEDLDEALRQVDAEYSALGEKASLSLSADANGIEHALHLNQTADHVAFPTLKDFEDFRTELWWGPFRNKMGFVAGKATDYWSLLTLFGLRFSMRNAIEELGLYWMTGGTVEDLYKGRRGSQAIRRVRNHVYAVTDEKTNEVTPVFRSSRGMVGKRVDRARNAVNKIDAYRAWAGRPGRNPVERMYKDWITNVVVAGFDPEELALAQQAYAAGDHGAFLGFFQKSVAAQRLTGWSKADIDALTYLVDTPHGLAQLDDLAEASKYLNAGGLPAYRAAADGVEDFGPGVAIGKVSPTVSTRLGAYENVPAVQKDVNGRDIWGVSFWWRELQHTMDGDGPMGIAAVVNLRNPAEAKKAVAAVIRADRGEYQYAQRLSAITDDLSIDQFADRYVENVFHHFTKADGSLNEDLLSRFVDKDGNFLGWMDQVESESGEIVSKFRVTKDDLQKYDKKNKPEFVFGQAVEQQPWIPIAQDLPSILSGDRAFTWMGAQNARISREPIFIANYLDQYAKTAEAREQFAKGLAASKGREVDAADRELANRIYANRAMDNAYSMTLAYVDNPANRSNLAWKARNVARYYRATEDYYRRMQRVAKVKPEAFWKGALTYHILSDSGFVYTNDSGEKYFVYPGNEYLQDTIRTIGTTFFGLDYTDYYDVDPFKLGGRVLGLTPSSDPNQAVPSTSGFVSGLLLTTVFQKFPAAAGLRALLMGNYSKQTGNYMTDAWQAVLPAGVMRAASSMNPEARDASIAQSTLDAIAIMAANGMLNTLTVDGKPIDMSTVTHESFKLTDQFKTANTMAVSLFWTKTLMSWIVPASPQVYTNDVSDFARANGADSMNDAWKDLMDRHRDDPDPMAAALREWYGLQAASNKNSKFATWDSFLPFTLSTYKYNTDSSNGGSAVNDLTRPTPTTDALAFYNSNQDLFSNKRFKNVAWFLAPRTGDFSWASWQVQKVMSGIRVTKTEDEMLDDLFALQGRYKDSTIRQYYQGALASATSDVERRGILQEQKVALQANRDANPAWSNAYTPPDQQMLRSTVSDMRDLLDYMKNRDGKLSPDAKCINNAINIWMYYSSQMAGIQGAANAVGVRKKDLEAQMNAELAVQADASPQAKVFIDSVLADLTFETAYPAVFGGQ